MVEVVATAAVVVVAPPRAGVVAGAPIDGPVASEEPSGVLGGAEGC